MSLLSLRWPHARPVAGRLGAFALTSLIALPAHACPGCDTSVVVWFTVREDQPATWLVVAALPFVLVALLGAALHRLGHPARRPALTAPAATEAGE